MLAFPPTSKWRIKIAGRLSTAVLNAFHFDAIVFPWRTIYIRDAYKCDMRLLNHELAHIAQIDRDGALYFWPKIVFDYFWHGYQASPYEIEARTYETQ